MAADEIAKLRAEVETLREALRQCRQALRPEITLPAWWGLTKRETLFLAAMYAAGTGVVTVNRMYLALFGPESENGHKGLNVYAYRVRNSLRDLGLPMRVTTVWGRGWQLDPESAEFLRAVIEDGHDVEHAGGFSSIPHKGVGPRLGSPGHDVSGHSRNAG